MTSERWHKLAEKGKEEVRRFLWMFLYLWVVFGLFVLNQAVVLGKTEMNVLGQGFALINAVVLAKVMLIAEELKVGRQFERLPMVYSIPLKSAAFAVVFMAFHVLEKFVIARVAGKSVDETYFSIGGGTWVGLACVWAILAISLLPFFILKEIGQALGQGELLKLMLRRRPAAPTP